jgi:hypothetical protein
VGRRAIWIDALEFAELTFEFSPVVSYVVVEVQKSPVRRLSFVVLAMGPNHLYLTFRHARFVLDSRLRVLPLTDKRDVWSVMGSFLAGEAVTRLFCSIHPALKRRELHVASEEWQRGTSVRIATDNLVGSWTTTRIQIQVT